MSGKSERIAQLELQLVATQRALDNLRACDVGQYVKSQSEILTLSKKCLKGSAVIIQARHLSGDVALSPVAISDGLSVDCLRAILADIRASHSLRLTINQMRDLP